VPESTFEMADVNLLNSSQEDDSWAVGEASLVDESLVPAVGVIKVVGQSPLDKFISTIVVKFFRRLGEVKFSMFFNASKDLIRVFVLE